MNIKDYLKGKVNYPVKDENILVILTDRDISQDADTVDLTKEQKELAYADLLAFLSTVFSGTGATNRRGNWSETESGTTISVNDRLALKKQAESIYSKYGEALIKTYTSRDGTNLW